MRRPVEQGRKGMQRRAQPGFKRPCRDGFASTHHHTVPMAPTVPLARLVLVALLAPRLGVAFPSCDYPVHLWCSSREIAVACQVESHCTNLSRPAAAPVELSLYYESLCPACREFLVQELFTTWLLLPAEALSITLVPYGNAEERNISGKWNFQCQHGPEECLGNMIETCLMHEAKNFSTYFPVIFCLESGSSVTKNLEAVCVPRPVHRAPLWGHPSPPDLPVCVPLSLAVPAGLCPTAGWGPHHCLRAGGHRGCPDAPQRPADRGTQPPTPIRTLDRHQWEAHGRAAGTGAGLAAGADLPPLPGGEARSL